MKRRIITDILCVFCFALLLAGCGRPGVPAGNEDNEANNQPVPIETEKAFALTPSDSASYKWLLIDDVVSELKSAGFTNIVKNEISDITLESSIAEGTVESILIDGKEFDKGQEFAANAKVEITYHTMLKIPIPVNSSEAKEMTTEDLREAFSSAGFIMVSFNEQYDLDPDKNPGGFMNEVSINGSELFGKNEEISYTSEIVITTHYTFDKYALKLNIDFDENLIFSRYDVNLFVNNEKHSTLPHGQDAAIELRLVEGDYTFLFVNSEDDDVKGEFTIHVDCDIDAEYNIHCFNDHVQITENFIDYKRELAENEVKMTGTERGFLYKNYKDVVAQLEEIGFTNIKAVPDYDIFFGITEEESVEDVEIDGGTSYKKGTILQKDVEVIVRYHMPYDQDPDRQTSASTPSSSSSSSQSTTDETKEASKAPEDDILTINNNEDLAQILTAEYVDSEKQAEFVRKYKGRVIEFDCMVYMLIPTDSQWVWSYVLVPGDTNQMGASLFMVKHASSATFNWDSATRPSSLEMGSKMRIRAKVTSGDESMYIYLDPVKTWGR